MASATKSSRELQLEAEVDRLRGFVDEATRGANQAHALARDQYDQFERVSESLIRSGEFLRRVLAGSGDCIKVLDLDTRLQFMNTGGLVVMEIVEFEPFVGCPWLEFWTGQFETAARAAVETAKNGQVGRFQGFCATAKGTPKWWDVQVLPLVGLDGKPEQLLSISTDITERKRAEDHQRVLMQELEHRVKNTLALVQSIANQTFRDGPAMAEARETFAARLHALTEAHDLLIQTSWGSANIAAVVASVIAPHIDDQQTRFRIDGRDVSLAPRPALALTMALHELCTNAAKYGALSNQKGYVSINWRIIDHQNGPLLRFIWKEQDGPSVKPPTRQGFGSRLIERTLAAEFEDGVTLVYEPAGVVCAIECSLAAIQQPANTDEDPDFDCAARCTHS